MKNCLRHFEEETENRETYARDHLIAIKETLCAIESMPGKCRQFFTVGGFKTPELPRSSGLAAIEIAMRQPVDLAIVDLQMPGMDGFDLLKAILAQDPEAEVILITGHGDMQMAYTVTGEDQAPLVPFRHQGRRLVGKAARITPEDAAQLLELGALVQDQALGRRSGHSLEAAHPGSHAALAGDPEGADIAGAQAVGRAPGWRGDPRGRDAVLPLARVAHRPARGARRRARWRRAPASLEGRSS